MQFNGYHHIGLKVKDMDKSLKFYKALGGKETFSFPMGGDANRMIYMVDMGGHSVVELIPTGYGEPEANARWAHICLDTDDCRAAFDEAVKAGAACQSEPNDCMLGTMSVTNAFVVGPDQEVIEFFQVHGTK